MFTFGPWSFISRGYHPGTHLLSVSIWLVLALIFWKALHQAVTFFTSNLLKQAFFLLAFPAFCSIPVGDDFDSRIVAWSLLLLISHFFVSEGKLSLTNALLVLSLSLFSLTKFTGFMAAVTILGVIGLDDLLRKRVPALPIVGVLGLVLFWTLASQDIGNIPAFFSSSMQITGGYTEAMMLDLTHAEYRLWWYIAISVCILVSLFLALRRVNQRRAWLFTAGIAALLFLSFKHGFVRCDSHEALSATSLILVLLSLLILSCTQAYAFQTALVVISTAAVLLTYVTFNICFPQQGVFNQLSDTFRLSTLVAPIKIELRGELKQEYEADRAAVRNQIDLPNLQCTADLYTWYLNGIFAYNFHYQPRPVNQSYSAYTPYLLRANKEFLTSANAPALIVFQPMSLDNRYPAFDDGTSWPELLTRYSINQLKPGFPLLLTKVEQPGSYTFNPVNNTTEQLGHEVNLPSNNLLWATVDIKPTLWGRMMLLLYKPSYIYMEVILHDGTRKKFRLVPGIARAGFLLSPFIHDVEGFKGIGEVQGVSVAKLTISESSNLMPCYQSSYKIDFKELTLKKPVAH